MPFKNRRSVPRHPFFGEAIIIMPDKKEFTALIANMSLKGMCIYSTVHVEELTQITVKITFTDTSSKEQKTSVEGIVCWTNKKNDFHGIGIRFKEELNSKNQPILYKHISTSNDLLHPIT